MLSHPNFFFFLFQLLKVLAKKNSQILLAIGWIHIYKDEDHFTTVTIFYS